MQSSPVFARLGTRGSALALRQAHLVRALLARAHGVAEDEIVVMPMTTSGDRLTDRPLSEAGGKGLFTKEIERALIDAEIDIAVHSAKDMATRLPDGLVLAAVPEREDVRDAFVSLDYGSLEALPRGARLGTSSLRRAAQMSHARPDLEIVGFRGNVQTRLDKLRRGVAQATLLAMAGLNRLGKTDEARGPLDPDRFPPAPAQGAIGLEIRAGDGRAAELVAPLDHSPSHAAVLAERAFLGVLNGSCRTPIGAYSRIQGARLTMIGEILSPDGRLRVRAELDGPAGEAAAVGRALGEKLLAEAAPDIVALLRSLQ